MVEGLCSKRGWLQIAVESPVIVHVMAIKSLHRFQITEACPRQRSSNPTRLESDNSLGEREFVFIETVFEAFEVAFALEWTIQVLRLCQASGMPTIPIP